MLSSVSKLADKAFVMGFFLPALLAVYAALKILHCAPWFTALCDVKQENPFENLTYVALAVWVLAVLLLTLNYFVYRFLEGYVFPISSLKFLKRWHVRRYRRLLAKRDRLSDRGEEDESSVLAFDLLNTYPQEESDILPTLFGNRIRSFELYPWDVYRADGVIVWLRLQSVIPGSFQQTIADARAQVDFFINIWLLSLVMVIGAAIKLLTERAWDPAAFDADHVMLVVTIAVAVGVMAIAYWLSIGRIVAWGDTVKTAFDCYLPALASQLGYEPPATESERRAFWDDLSGVFIFREKVKDGRWKLSSAKPSKAGGKDGGSGADGADGGDDD